MGSPQACRRKAKKSNSLFFYIFFFPSPLFPQGLVCSRKDCFTGQSPGLWKGGWRRPSPSQISLGGGWQAAGAGGVEGCLGEHLAEGGFVALHIGLVGTILGQQAGRECLHGSMTEQSGPAGDEGC